MKSFTYQDITLLPKSSPYVTVHRVVVELSEMACIDFRVLAEWAESYGVLYYRVETDYHSAFTVRIRPNGYADFMRDESSFSVAPLGESYRLVS